ncbi:MAG TPA: MarR family transcriptional regulator [Ktedonobacterales bacterium]|nr:MarR family transcriptional regulator [Ktedonobacterales bacterium]
MKQSIVAWLRLVHFYHKADRKLLLHLRCYDLSLAQFDVLAQLGAAEGITQQELADKLLVTKGNVTQLLDRMTVSGLLTRRQDGRANRLYLTDAGRALFTAVIPAHEDEVAKLFTVLSSAEQAQLSAMLRKLDRALEAPPCDEIPPAEASPAGEAGA